MHVSVLLWPVAGISKSYWHESSPSLTHYQRHEFRTLAAPTASGAAEIKVLTGRAMNHVLTELASGFQRTSER